MNQDSSHRGFQKGHRKMGGWITKSRNCLMCGQSFLAVQPNHRYCGSKTLKTGCSWVNVLQKKKMYSKTNHMREYSRKYGRIWKRRQRVLETSYYQRQKLSNLRWRQQHKEDLLLRHREWRVRNLKRVLANNRIYHYSKMGKGSFKYSDWQEMLKNTTRCPKCGITREELLEKYGIQFGNFTMDHIIPLSSPKGTNTIGNIRPLCIGCNARKRNKMPTIAYVGATMDTPHHGHVELLKKAKELADIVVVVLNKDDFVEKFKGRKPIFSLEERRRVIESFWMVDIVDVNEGGADSKPMLLKYNPDFIIIGDDYDFDKYCQQMGFDEKWLLDHNMQVVFVPYSKDISSTIIKERIGNFLNKKP